MINRTNSLKSIGCSIKSLIYLKFDQSFDPITIDRISNNLYKRNNDILSGVI
jgi:hypothetical protein